ncbi:NADH:flavin oxidoreductase/NADH oxidase [Granulicoccus phenolivorans]|uniref:NADH:flavin oxidoreductase/NADH oxidase n=1 Tax=Granulicoccus phenolivorans TaxID=266854 RepID=UPI000423AF2C
MSKLFEPITLRGTTIRNRAWLAAMCQYSVEKRDGVPTDWHLAHLGARAQGGFGLVMTEATAVSPEGRITPHDTGIWNDELAAAWRRITDFLRSQGATPAIQLAHAGRKASTRRGFPGEERGVASTEEGGWTPVGPSAIAFGDLVAPHELSSAEIATVIADFTAAARRAVDAGFEVLEIHGAHGYLMHQFLSPMSNQRTDEYGGSFPNRTRLLLQVVDAVRAEVGEQVPLIVRISATDWVEDQPAWTLDQSVELSRVLREHGVDLVDVSSGGNALVPIEVGPGYQVPLSTRIRTETGIATGAVGLITEPAQAEQVLRAGQADVVLLGRVALREPAWPQRAAHELGMEDAADAIYPPQYRRGVWA